MEIAQRKRRPAPTIRTVRADVAALRAEWTAYRAEMVTILDGLILAAAALDLGDLSAGTGRRECCPGSPE